MVKEGKESESLLARRIWELTPEVPVRPDAFVTDVPFNVPQVVREYECPHGKVIVESWVRNFYFENLKETLLSRGWDENVVNSIHDERDAWEIVVKNNDENALRDIIGDLQFNIEGRRSYYHGKWMSTRILTIIHAVNFVNMGVRVNYVERTKGPGTKWFVYPEGIHVSPDPFNLLEEELGESTNSPREVHAINVTCPVFVSVVLGMYKPRENRPYVRGFIHLQPNPDFLLRAVMSTYLYQDDY